MSRQLATERRPGEPDTKAYYDAFSAGYERGRDRGYHALVDELESELAGRYCAGGTVLEVGCGTGLILERLRRVAGQAFGADLSRGMLGHAMRKQLTCVQAEANHLPFPSDHFDLVCSFKVLAHVKPIEAALAELVRVTRPGGHLVLEFYNAASLRYLIKRLRPGLPVARGLRDDAVYTRYDTLGEIRARLPASVEIVGMRGIRVLTFLPQALALPVVGPLLERAETFAADAPLLRRLGGFLIVVGRKRRV